MLLEVFQSAGEAGRNGVAITGRAQVARNAYHTNNRPVLIAHGQFGSEAPARTAMSIPVQFEVIDDWPAGSEDFLVLFSVESAQFAGKDFADVAANKLIFVAATDAFDEGLVHREVTAFCVLNEEGRIWDVVEKLLNNGQFWR